MRWGTPGRIVMIMLAVSAAMKSWLIVAACAAVVAISLLIWHAGRPPSITLSQCPAVLRRGVYWWIGLMVFFGGSALAWVLLRDALGLPRNGLYRFVPLALGLVPALVVNPLWWWRTHRIRSLIRDSEGRMCTHCAYLLENLPDQGQCPECGRAYDVPADKWKWGTLVQNSRAVHSSGHSPSHRR